MSKMTVRKFRNLPYDIICRDLGIESESRLIWFIDDLVRKQEYYSTRDDQPMYGCKPFPFSSEEISMILSYRKKPILDYLVNKGYLTILEIPSRVRHHKNPKVFRLEFKLGGYKWLTITHHKILHSYKKLWKRRKDPIRIQRLLHVANQTADWDFNISRDEIEDLLEYRYKPYVEEKEFLNKIPKEFMEYRKDQLTQLSRMDTWSNSDKHTKIASFMKVDKFSKRFHTIFSTTMKELRTFLTYKGNPVELVELDIDCSEPTILANLLTRSGVSCKFVDIISTEDFHSYMALKKGISRKLAKLDNCQLLFCKHTSKKHLEFCEIFPVAGEFLTKMKTEKVEGLGDYYAYKTITDKNGKQKTISTFHKSVAYTLQSEEVNMMRDVWNGLIANKIPFVPVHDAIYVPKQFKHQAKDIFDNCLLIRGFTGTVSCEQLEKFNSVPTI